MGVRQGTPNGGSPFGFPLHANHKKIWHFENLPNVVTNGPQDAIAPLA